TAGGPRGDGGRGGPRPPAATPGGGGAAKMVPAAVEARDHQPAIGCRGLYLRGAVTASQPGLLARRGVLVEEQCVRHSERVGDTLPHEVDPALNSVVAHGGVQVRAQDDADQADADVRVEVRARQLRGAERAEVVKQILRSIFADRGPEVRYAPRWPRRGRRRTLGRYALQQTRGEVA